jgi:hypothetical protein
VAASGATSGIYNAMHMARGCLMHSHAVHRCGCLAPAAYDARQRAVVNVTAQQGSEQAVAASAHCAWDMRCHAHAMHMPTAHAQPHTSQRFG